MIKALYDKGTGISRGVRVRKDHAYVGETLQRQLQSTPAPPVGSQHSFQPTVQLHTLPLAWISPSGNGVVRGRRGQQLEFTLGKRWS